MGVNFAGLKCKTLRCENDTVLQYAGWLSVDGRGTNAA